jgi:hypothetical protein
MKECAARGIVRKIIARVMREDDVTCLSFSPVMRTREKFIQLEVLLGQQIDV